MCRTLDLLILCLVEIIDSNTAIGLYCGLNSNLQGIGSHHQEVVHPKPMMSFPLSSVLEKIMIQVVASVYFFLIQTNEEVNRLRK